ncbi:hypothetical protein AJ85_19185 [Alkalihalobacillus alcalophilus ATCC 27647 = CGMCC 1.3604]|uniref:Membrane protein n=1 Tax=Alkalihalobacillus alcalophilus ATCC 27647 = CGMCC 1.3604 TaxID=1218173 RepID=A0A094WLC1_ALKAL|nr:DUF421 domain-containing protein [Alkalihalobacillus alcalophilus]KGA98559.1 membrane protein [Alkalihalobacillus alcalophilus ATCC 27647 = CGMCC 1.3604]MED1560400.1 DUF421 domain-containing protein [Alkalihalobacillus alcalophilus]THG89178.1 hypothetical protein AJ85_19185 [Alkalihalobacillus alcalophilus ATCC 27647 = CGMCC 1.3604]
MPGWVEIIVRSIVAIILLYIVSKMIVKKPIGESSFFEFALLTSIVIIAAISATMLTIPSALAFTALFVWSAVTALIYYLSVKSAKFRVFLFGRGTPVIQGGKILEDALNKQHLTGDELMRKLRKKDVFQFADVEFALLETNGELNVLLKEDKKQAVARSSAKKNKQPETVVADGRILDQNLGNRGLNRDWLQTQLAKQDVSLESVFLAQIDANGDLYVDLFDDSLQQQDPVTIPLLKATLQKVQADLQLYSLDTDNPTAKAMFKKCAEEMNEAYLEIERDLR